jgi:hypothetical protein
VRLAELDPKLTDGRLRFRCPACGEHQISIPVGPVFQAVPPIWSVAGTLENLTVRPSIDALTPPCRWHGFITNGAIETC